MTPTERKAMEAGRGALAPFATARMAQGYDSFPDFAGVSGGEGLTFADFRRAAAALSLISASLQEQGEQEGWQPTHRHKARGTTYRIVGRAQVQAPKDDPLTDYELVVVYQGHDGELWVRRVAEFEDGRFERLPAPPVEGGE